MTLEISLGNNRVCCWSGKVSTELRNARYDALKRRLERLPVGWIANGLVNGDSIRLQLQEADIGLNRYWSESNKSWADIRYNINKATGHVLERDSAITTYWPSLSWSALLFSIKTEINRSPNIMSFGRISDNSKNLRKPEKAKKTFLDCGAAKDHWYQFFPLIFWDSLPREVPFDVLQESRLDEPRPLWPLLLWGDLLERRHQIQIARSRNHLNA